MIENSSMEPKRVIAIFDIGKTNKKVFLFDEAYTVVYEMSGKHPEITDEDGFPCDDLKGIEDFVHQSLQKIFALPDVVPVAVNFTTYGASFVFIDAQGHPLTPLYNYLKPYPVELQSGFYGKYGGEDYFSMITASPVLGSLNSGMQVYRLKHEQAEKFAAMQYALHLPQYISYLVTGRAVTDITSVGCHTNLWDFSTGNYHRWVAEEGISEKLAPLADATTTYDINLHGLPVKAGIGLHDSSSALIPYMMGSGQPFALLSTGTWCITLNPFNEQPLTIDELKADCLAYLSYQGKPVKAARLFAGHEHDEQVSRIAAHFTIEPSDLHQTAYDPAIIADLQSAPVLQNNSIQLGQGLATSVFGQRNLDDFSSAIEAYHQLMLDIVAVQVWSSSLVLQNTPVSRLYVDGGFSKNELYMKLLSNALPGMELYAASLAQATALGAAMVIHNDWNSKPVPVDMVTLKKFQGPL